MNEAELATYFQWLERDRQVDRGFTLEVPAATNITKVSISHVGQQAESGINYSTFHVHGWLTKTMPSLSLTTTQR